MALAGAGKTMRSMPRLASWFLNLTKTRRMPRPVDEDEYEQGLYNGMGRIPLSEQISFKDAPPCKGGASLLLG